MPAPTLPRFHSLNSLSKATSIERGVLERMMAHGVIAADAQLKFGEHYTPLFLEAKALEILLARSDVVYRHDQLPRRTDPV